MSLATTWSNLWRGAFALVLVLPLTVVAFMAGLGAQPLAWIAAPLVLAVVTGALTGLLWSGRRERRPAVAVALVLGALLGAAVWTASPPGPRVLARHLESIELPEGARLVEENTSGNVLCFDYCPSLSRTYAVPGHPDDVARRMERALGGSRFGPLGGDRPGGVLANGSDVDVHVTIDVGPGSSGGTRIVLTATGSARI